MNFMSESNHHKSKEERMAEVADVLKAEMRDSMVEKRKPRIVIDKDAGTLTIERSWSDNDLLFQLGVLAGSMFEDKATHTKFVVPEFVEFLYLDDKVEGKDYNEELWVKYLRDTEK